MNLIGYGNLSRTKISVLRPMELSSLQTKIAVFVYNIGKYDGLSFVKKKVPNDIDAFYYTIEGDVSENEVELLRSQGWKIVFTTKSEGTTNNLSDRLTSKRLKWNSSDEFDKYDFVLTHDCNIYINYEKIRDFIESEMHDCSVLLKDFPYNVSRPRIMWEIDDFLTTRVDRIKESVDETKKWKDMLLKEKKTLDSDLYFETNVFIFKPRCPKYKTFGKKVYEHCHKLQRDQFIVPYVLLHENVPYKVKTSRELTEKIQYSRMSDGHLTSENQQRIKDGKY